jgi:hypothetical protein
MLLGRLVAGIVLNLGFQMNVNGDQVVDVHA